MTITQTVEIPADRWLNLNFEIPREVPSGKAQIELKVIPFVKPEEKEKHTLSIMALRGSCKGLDSMDAYFKRKRADKEFENGQTKDSPYKIKD